ncbi:MAG: formimidoylglutamase [Bdellovibrionaceae bacterium]|nr:formimidoylglutamase [Pseudobdellovibrionaceae bacterium]MBX3034723.1 formimidoylglutamase [Pseudobdellovibrionaceae bacterium]
MAHFQAVDPNLLFSRQDPADPRWGERVLTARPAHSGSLVQLFGWPDDEGIRLNGGRPGAAQAPDRIRRFLYRMTPAVDVDTAPPALWDRGNLLTAPADLAERHRRAREAAHEAHARGDRTLSFGGGHDYGFPDSAAFLQAYAREGRRPVVVNFDAHLDVRPADHGFHSGTPFRRLIEEFHGRFDFLEIGLQPQCNSREHWAWARSRGAELWGSFETPDSAGLLTRLDSWAAARRGQELFISLDIDALNSEAAPGCSQSWAWGLSPVSVTQALRRLYQLFDVRGLGLYEVSPPLDQDDRTSKLAALFAHDFLSRGSSKETPR